MKKIILATGLAILRYPPLGSNGKQFLQVYEISLQTVLVSVNYYSK